VNILVISHMYPYPANITKGIFVHQQNLELMRQGCSLTVLAPRPWVPYPLGLLPRWRHYCSIPKAFSRDGIAVRRPAYLVFPAGLGMARSGFRLYRALHKHVAELHKKNPFAVIHAHTILPDGQAGHLLKRQLGIPLVITVHGKDVQQTACRNHSCRQAIINAVREADMVVAVSSKLKDMLDEITHMPDKTAVIHNGFDSSRYIEIQPSAQAGSIISVSNLVKTKRLDLNLHAVAVLRRKYPYIRYTVAGDGEEAANLQRLARDLQIDDIVEFTGRVPNQDVPGLLAKAQIFSLPSSMEGFGIAYLEAMAAGLPVIGCKGEGIADVVCSGKTGMLIEADDLDALVKALDQLLANPDAARGMGSRARKLVLDKYSWHTNAKKMINLFAAIDSSSGKGNG
jgi:teichuronic acid biosynthesis glycosyltransferase TuaC